MNLDSRIVHLRPSLPASKISSRFRPTWAEVSAGAFASNLRAFKSLVGLSTRVMAVLKADAYGHGAALLAPVALEAGADMIGVSSIEEGVELRSSGIRAEILILGTVYPLENFPAAVEAGLTPTVSSVEGAAELASVAARVGRPLGFHLKVDTGMGRLGVSPAGARAVLQAALEKGLRLEGVYSHLASADSDPAYTAAQLAELLKVRDIVRSLGVRDAVFHIANSAAALSLPASRLDMIRPGIALYGAPSVSPPAGIQFRPVLAWKSAIVFLKRVPAGTTISYGRTFKASREADIATLPVGYADGVPRSVSNKAVVLVRGRRCPLVGRVTMDHVMIDVSGTGAGVGDEAVLIGNQASESVTADEWARWAGTISYEIFCGISKRVPREAVL